jgi:DNA repair exonuclease SbcCD nuclease subunit
MKFIHISDVHLGVVPDKGKVWSDTRAKEIESTFDKIIDAANEKQVDLLLVAGNLFHSSPDLSKLVNLDRKLSRLETARCVIAPGAADYIDKDSQALEYEFESDTVILPPGEFSNVYYEDINTCVTGFGYGKAEYTESFAEGMTAQMEGATNIMLMYGGDSKHGHFNFKALSEAGFDYIALGSLRKPKHMVKNRMAYSGSPEPVSSKDTGKHGYIYGQSIGDQTRIKFVPLSCRNYINLGLEIKPEYTAKQIQGAIKRQIDKMGSQNIYKVILKGQKGRDVRISLSDFPQDYMIYDIVDNTVFDYNRDALMRGNANNLLGRYIESFAGKNDAISSKAISYGLDAIIATGDK